MFTLGRWFCLTTTQLNSVSDILQINVYTFLISSRLKRDCLDITRLNQQLKNTFSTNHIIQSNSLYNL